MTKYYCFISPQEKYQKDLLFFCQKLNLNIFQFQYFHSTPCNNNISCIKVRSLKDVLKVIRKDDIVLGFGRGFGGIPFEHIAYFLHGRCKKVLCISDGVAINDNNFNFQIFDSEKSKKNILREYIKFYGCAGTFFIIIMSIFGKKVDYFYTFKNFGVLEFSLFSDE